MVGPKKTKFSVIIHFTNHDILISTMSQNVTTMTFLVRTMTFSKLFKKQTTRTIYFRKNYQFKRKIPFGFCFGGGIFIFIRKTQDFRNYEKMSWLDTKKPNFQL